MKQGFSDTLLVFRGKTQDFSFLNRATGSLAHSRYDKIRQASPFDFRRSFEQSVDIGGQPRLQTSRR